MDNIRTEEELLQEAMRRLEAEDTAPPHQPAADMPEDAKTLLEAGKEVWDSIGAGMAKAGIETKDFIFGEPEEHEKSDFRRGIENRAQELQESSVVNSVTMGITQIATGLIGAGKLMAPIKAVQKLKGSGTAGRAAYEVGLGAAAGAVVIDPHEERLSNLIEDFPSLQNPVTEYLAAGPTDSAAEGRFKNALEGIGVDFALIGVVKAIKFMRSGDPAAAKKEIAKLERGGYASEAEAARVANQNEFGLDFGLAPRETPVETNTGPAASVEATTPARGREAVPESPRGEEARLEFEERAAVLEYEGGLSRAEAERQAASETGYRPEGVGRATSPSGETNQTGRINPDLPSPIRETPSSVAPRGPALVDASPEAVAKIVLDTEADLKAIAKFGSREAAIEAGRITGRSASRLPWQKLIETPDGLREFLSNAEAATKRQMDAIKGGDVLSDSTVNAKVREMAEWYGEDPATLMGELVEAGGAAAQMTARMEAAYLVTNRMFQETYELAFKLQNGMLDEFGGDAAKAAAELRDRLRLSASILASAQSMRANAGRTMRRLRGQFQIKPEDLASLDGMDASRLAELIASTKGDPKKLAQVANPTFLRRAMNEVNFSLTNSLLWLYPTHVVNVTSNVVMLLGRPTEKLLGAIAMGPKTSGDILRQQAIAEYSATAAALGDAWQSMAMAFLRGDSILNPHNTEFFQGAITQQPLQWKSGGGIMGLAENAWKAANYRNIVGLPTRTLGAVDEFFKTLRYRAYVQGQAAGRAHSLGLTGEDFQRYLRAEMEKAIDPATGQALDQRALREAQTATFQNELLAGTAGATIQQARNRHPVLTLILPFVKTPVNVLRYGWKMTPGLNLIQKEFREAIAGAHGAEAKAHAIGQMALGVTFMGLAAMLTLNGRMTGAGPAEPRLQAELRATGWQPYSYVFEEEGGTKRYVPMGRFDPAGMAFATIANLMDALRQNPESSGVESGIGATALALAKAFSDRTFLQNMHQALEALSDPEARGERWLGNIAGNAIPLSSALRGLNPDPYLREARSFVDTTLKNLPGFSATLPPVRDVFGEPVARRIGITTDQKADLVEAEHSRILIETGRGIGKPEPDFEGVDLRDVTLESGQNAYDRYQELSGHIPGQKPLKDHLARLIKSDAYQDMPDGEAGVVGTRLNALGRIVTQHRQAARARLLRESPELQSLVKARQRKARGAIIQNRSQRAGGQPGARELLDALGPQEAGVGSGHGEAQSILDQLRAQETARPTIPGGLRAVSAERLERLQLKREDDIRRADESISRRR
ncbi:MAG: hypothetical protein M9945_08940 [Aquamicrobium sp.]|uniref:hypothetical protein n=1 Tax=Aquamicrobium sp. TaxID=1872579 RepID=UPI00349E7A09|nr:hypothetical protein [Aquamicrobium sp.]